MCRIFIVNERPGNIPNSGCRSPSLVWLGFVWGGCSIFMWSVCPLGAILPPLSCCTHLITVGFTTKRVEDLFFTIYWLSYFYPLPHLCWPTPLRDFKSRRNQSNTTKRSVTTLEASLPFFFKGEKKNGMKDSSVPSHRQARLHSSSSFV